MRLALRVFLLSLLSVAAHAQIQLGGHVYVPSASDSTLGASNVVYTANATCTILTATNCTVSGGAGGPYAGTLNVSGTLTGPQSLVVVLSPGRSYVIRNSTAQTLTAGGATGATVPVPAGSTVSINSPDGVGYYAAGGSSAPTAGQITTAIQTQSGCTTAGNVWLPQSGTCVPQSGGGSVNSSATINAANTQVQADSIVSGLANGMVAYGDSITAGVGCASGPLCYVPVIGSDLGVSPVNNAVAGDRAGDMTWHVFNGSNPSDTNNPIVTSMVGTNDAAVAATTPNLLTYSKEQYASAAWAAVSSTNKILAGNANVTQSGTWTADTTFANANGLISTTPGDTLTYACQIGTPGVFYVYYRMNASDGTFNVSVDGTPATDTVGNSTTVSGTWAYPPSHQTVTVGLARFVTTAGAHSCVIANASGTIDILGFGFPPIVRYRGVSAPRFLMGGVPPTQNNSLNPATVPVYNATTLAISKQLVADGLYTPFVDTNTLDPNIDFNAIQNCPASNQPGLHPNNCGHRHLAQLFESIINGAPSTPNSALTSPLNFNGITGSATLPGTTNGGQNTTTYPPAGTSFSPNTYCLSGVSAFGWCSTFIGTGGGPFYHMMTANAGSGRFAFSFVPSNATPTQAVAGITSYWAADGSAHLNPGVTVSTTATGNVLANAMTVVPANLSLYPSFTSPTVSTTALMSGINFVPSGGNSAGVHFLYHTLPNGAQAYGPGFFLNNGQNTCLAEVYAGVPSGITGTSGFTCAAGIVGATGLVSAGPYQQTGTGANTFGGQINLANILNQTGASGTNNFAAPISMTTSGAAAPFLSVIGAAPFPSLASLYQFAGGTSTSTTAILGGLNIAHPPSTGGSFGGLVYGFSSAINAVVTGLLTQNGVHGLCFYTDPGGQSAITLMSQIACPMWGSYNGTTDLGTFHAPSLALSGTAAVAGNINQTGASGTNNFAAPTTFAGVNANSVELGAPAVAGTPTLDFHSAGTSDDYDVRLIANGGGGGNGNGGLSILANLVTLPATNAPTPAPGDNSLSVATTAFVANAVSGITSPPFSTDGVANATQGALNIAAGTNVTLSNSGSTVTINATGGGGTGILSTTASVTLPSGGLTNYTQVVPLTGAASSNIFLVETTTCIQEDTVSGVTPCIRSLNADPQVAYVFYNSPGSVTLVIPNLVPASGHVFTDTSFVVNIKGI